MHLMYMCMYMHMLMYMFPVDTQAKFDSFVTTALGGANLGLRRNQTRFYSLYTSTGGTEANNQAMAVRAAGWIAASNSSVLMLDDASEAELTEAQVARFPLIFKRSPHTHDDTAREYFAVLLRWARYS